MLERLDQWLVGHCQLSILARAVTQKVISKKIQTRARQWGDCQAFKDFIVKTTTRVSTTWCCNTVSLCFLMHLLELVRTTTVYLKSLCHRLTLYFNVIKVSAKNSEVPVRFAMEGSKMCTGFGPLSGRGWLWSTVHVVGIFLFLMTHILDLIPVCLSLPNRNYYLGQTAVVVLIEADISFFDGFHSYAFCRSSLSRLLLTFSCDGVNGSF